METQFNPVFSFAAASALALAMGMAAGTANAIIMLTPATATATCDDNSNLGTLDAINTCFGTTYTDLTFGYKANVGGVDEGPYAGFYTTTFDNEPLDPEDALITWDGEGLFFDCPTCILIVKDGNQVPAQYLFDLGAWDGQESIQLTGFWPDQGAISHVEIWSGNGDGPDDPGQIPEPGVLFLLGAGLLGLGLARRRKSA